MRNTGVPQLQVTHIERLYSCDRSHTIDELTIPSLTIDFGQVWARYNFVQHIAQNWVRLWTTCFTKSHMTLGNMRVLRNRIAYDFGQHVAQNRMDFGQQ